VYRPSAWPKAPVCDTGAAKVIVEPDVDVELPPPQAAARTRAVANKRVVLGRWVMA
jgi:hypothetical protein